MRYYSDDPVRDFHRHSAKQERELAKLPKCAYCGEPITEEFCFEINDEIICIHCLKIYHRRDTEDYIE